jgi:hypothetical protein
MSLTFATANGMPMIVSAGRNAGRHVCERELPAEQNEPDDVVDERPDTGGGLWDGGPTERPHRESCDSECGDTERDHDDQNAGHDARQDVKEPQPESGEHEPDDVPEEG